MHGLRHPVLSPGLPARQPDSGLERPGLPRSVAGGDRAAVRDEQLPRVHGPAVPGAVRGVVRAQHQRRRRHDQGDREPDHRARLGGRLGEGASAGDAHGQAHRGHRIGPRRTGRRRSAEQGGPLGHCLRARGPHRRAAPLRDPRVQDGEARARSTARAHGGGRRPLPHAGAHRRRDSVRRAAPRVRRDRPRGRFDDPARPADPGPQSLGRSLRDGLPDRSRTGAARATPCRKPGRSRPRASAW